jgi:hypothetical protein
VWRDTSISTERVGPDRSAFPDAGEHLEPINSAIHCQTGYRFPLRLSLYFSTNVPLETDQDAIA